jgi:ubiquinone/menaquinone biosynthesis C-methylase UbiE
MNESKVKTRLSPEYPKSNIEWEQWGKDDPMFGVASLEGRNKNGSNPWTAQAFYSHGAKCWSEERIRWESYGVRRDACVEIGCGAGRMSKQLATYFGRVVGVDISDSMLTLARQSVPEATFVQTDGLRIPLLDGSMTAAFSCDVFQHFNEVKLAASYFAELYRVLAPGSTLMIHMPVYAMPRDFSASLEAIYRVWRLLYQRYFALRRAAIRLRLGRLSRPFMYGVQYERQWVFDSLHKAGFEEVKIQFQTYRSYVFARKPE